MGLSTYLLTFTCHGTWLPGDRRGFTDHARSAPRHPGVGRSAPELLLHCWTARRLRRPPFNLDDSARAIVGAALQQACAHARWTLHAHHVRTNHVHAVVTGETAPARMMSYLKARATFHLRCAGLAAPDAVPWTRGGSFRPLLPPGAIASACSYVVHGQGMALPAAGEAAGNWGRGRPEEG